jgi:transposase
MDKQQQPRIPETRHYGPGSDEGGANWAAIASLIETCKLNGVDPQAYFTDLLTRLVNGWPQARIDELMPWNYGRQTIH